MNFQELYDSDLKRYGKDTSKYLKKFHYFFRKSQTTSNCILAKYYHFRYHRLKDKNGLEIDYHTQIGKGFYIGHPHNITINESALIGENVNIHKGATIGRENRGERKGAPTIGDCVWIGINATIVGRITIGDDVMIAPNSYVNCDVPAHSIVFGNPCRIIHRDNATKDYINNCI